MSIYVNRDTRAGAGDDRRRGAFIQADARLRTKIVGVTPGKAGRNASGLPVFDTVEGRPRSHRRERQHLCAAGRGGESILEAIDAGMELVVCITEGIPVQDMVKVRNICGGRRRA